MHPSCASREDFSTSDRAVSTTHAVRLDFASSGQKNFQNVLIRSSSSLSNVYTRWRIPLNIKTVALFAVLAAAAPLSSASAMTVAKQQAVATSSSSQVQKTDYKQKKNYHKRGHYRAGGRYNKAPSNWHRYNKRPHDWSRRGCIIVGPIWWCP